ncbi:MAG: hypothetical protein IKW84_04290 [Bacteroidaceae bacterium]|nr:hypothetical protein [Bacteroidaceae bacterium]
MKRSNIFNMERFLGLIGTGINRRNDVYAYNLIVAMSFFLVIVLITELAKRLEFDTARVVVTRVYQFAYITFLSTPVFRLTSNKERYEQWNLLPASAFEKYIFITVLSFVWRTIVFFFAIYAIDCLIWIETPYDQTMGLSQCLLRMSDFFLLEFFPGNVPLWLYYLMVFFFFTALPILIGSESNTSFNRAKPFWHAYIMYMLLRMLLDVGFKPDNLIPYVVIPVIAAFVFVHDLILSIRRSRYAKA